MPVAIPIVAGQPFDRLEIIKEGPKAGKRRTAYCRCECGTEKLIRIEDLRSGAVKSCGCRRREVTATLKQKHDCCRTGQATPEHFAWRAMRQRCNNPNTALWKNYGGRGIKIDPRWDDFAAFLADMGKRPSPEYSLDRIDNEGPYSPENCRWATRHQQSRNSSRNHLLVLDGETATLTDWAQRLGLKVSTIRRRLERGWTTERALTVPSAIERVE